MPDMPVVQLVKQSGAGADAASKPPYKASNSEQPPPSRFLRFKNKYISLSLNVAEVNPSASECCARLWGAARRRGWAQRCPAAPLISPALTHAHTEQEASSNPHSGPQAASLIQTALR